MKLKKKHRSNWKLYCIIDKKVIRERGPIKMALSLFKSGVKVIQLRYKNFPSYKLIRIAKKIQKLADKYEATLIINDRIDVALASGSKGVHLGEGDMNPLTVRRLLGPNGIVGKTAHSIKEAKKANNEKVNYLGVGPVFNTPLKKHLKGQGVNFIKKVKKCTPIPVLAIGGISEKNVASLCESGVDGVCVTRATKRAKSLLKKMNYA